MLHIKSLDICINLKFSCSETRKYLIGLKLYDFVSYIKLVFMM